MIRLVEVSFVPGVPEELTTTMRRSFCKFPLSVHVVEQVTADSFFDTLCSCYQLSHHRIELATRDY